MQKKHASADDDRAARPRGARDGNGARRKSDEPAGCVLLQLHHGGAERGPDVVDCARTATAVTSPLARLRTTAMATRLVTYGSSSSTARPGTSSALTSTARRRATGRAPRSHYDLAAPHGEGPRPGDARVLFMDPAAVRDAVMPSPFPSPLLPRPAPSSHRPSSSSDGRGPRPTPRPLTLSILTSSHQDPEIFKTGRACPLLRVGS